MNEFNLGDLPDLVSTFSEHQILFYAEACIAALESQRHPSGTMREFHGKVQINWEEKPQRAGLNDPRDLTEFGAIALAFCIVTNFSEYDIIEQDVRF